MKIEELRELLVKCWENGSSKGQCYVTALIVQDFFGGEMLRIKNDKLEISHYWNRLPNGMEVDLTSDQFEGGDGIHSHFKNGRVFTREQKLYPYYPTVVRYVELMMKLSKMLDKYTEFCWICGKAIKPLQMEDEDSYWSECPKCHATWGHSIKPAYG